MGQHYKESSAIALARREAALPKEYLLPSEALTNLPLNLTTIPRSSGHFTPSELEIIESEADVILPNIKSKKWSSLEVTEAFCKAAVVAQQLVCFRPFGLFLGEAVLTRRLDKLPDRNSYPRSPCSCKSFR